MNYNKKYLNDDRKIIASESLLVGNEEKKCSQCGLFTKFIDFCTESHICSEECMNKQNEWLNENCQNDYKED